MREIGSLSATGKPGYLDLSPFQFTSPVPTSVVNLYLLQINILSKDVIPVPPIMKTLIGPVFSLKSNGVSRSNQGEEYIRMVLLGHLRPVTAIMIFWKRV